MCHFKEIENRCRHIMFIIIIISFYLFVFLFGGYRTSFGGELPFRVCSMWLRANLLFGINRSVVRRADSVPHPLASDHRPVALRWQSQQRLRRRQRWAHQETSSRSCRPIPQWLMYLGYSRPREGGSPRRRFALKGGYFPKVKNCKLVIVKKRLCVWG